MCDGQLVRDPTALFYPTAIGGNLLVSGRSGWSPIAVREAIGSQVA